MHRDAAGIWARRRSRPVASRTCGGRSEKPLSSMASSNAAPAACGATSPVLPAAAPPRRAPIRTIFSRSLSPGLGDLRQDRAEARMSPAVLRRKVGAAEKRLQLRRQPHRHRPAAAAGRGLHERHVDAVDVGPLLAIHLDGHVISIQHRRDRLVFERSPAPSRGTSGRSNSRSKGRWACFPSRLSRTPPRPRDTNPPDCARAAANRDSSLVPDDWYACPASSYQPRLNRVRFAHFCKRLLAVGISVSENSIHGGAPREERFEDYETDPPANAGRTGKAAGSVVMAPLIQSAILSCASAAETGLKGVAGIDRVTILPGKTYLRGWAGYGDPPRSNQNRGRQETASSRGARPGLRPPRCGPRIRDPARSSSPTRKR